jgi:preprotein translocase subunit SecA
MFDFFVRKSAVKSAQKFIDRLEPKVSLHVPPDLPLPSIKSLKDAARIVARVNGMEDALAQLSDDGLRAKTREFEGRYQKAVAADKAAYEDKHTVYQKTFNPQEREDLTLEVERLREKYLKVKRQALDDLLPEAFAVVREAGKRVLGMRHFDVQIVGGIVLNNGDIAEMTTGEGKTLVATLPSYLNGLTREGVHVVTVNDYLARRDSEWMGPLHEFLGLTVGVIQHDMTPPQRQKAYACDITYGTNNEFGFDYLRDNMVNGKEEMVQRPHHYAVVDEVDSILIDEARTPLIISGPAEAATDKYYTANKIAKQLKGRRITDRDEINAKYSEEGIAGLSKGYDYLADEKVRSVSLTEEGEEKAARMFGIDNLHDMETVEYRHHILQAIKAHEFFKIDVDYVLRDGGVVIVDEFTGRLMPGRRWSDGLHQAVEAKEGIKIERENQTLATITFQNYFRLYEKLSGMTGTADTEAAEFKQIYKLDVCVVPTNKPVQRTNYGDSIYRSAREKFEAVVNEIEAYHKRGQPVLVGTISIEKSELVGRMLQQKGIPHQVLNAKFHEQEAQIISQAGRLGAVTIATNMAGRGTDIVLGGNAEVLAKTLAEEKSGREDDDDARAAVIKKFLEQFRRQTREEHEKVITLGGLHVIGTERHESRRIDNQLRGRQGRQGDPGSSRFFVSLEDDLMRLFASDRIIGLMDKLGMEEGQVLEHPWLSKALENAQRRVESHNFEIRKHLLEYDDVMNRQREVIYNIRRAILESDNVKGRIIEAIEDVALGLVEQYFTAGTPDGEVDSEGLRVYLQTKCGYELKLSKEEIVSLEAGPFGEYLRGELAASYDLKEREIDQIHLRRLEKMLLLHVIDSKWKDHLYAMDQLKDGISLRSYAQRDPLIEYKKEGFHMFQMMYSSINQEVVEIIFKLQPVNQPRGPQGVFSAVPKRFVHQDVSGYADVRPPAGVASVAPADRAALAPEHNAGPKVGRNDPCPCGSGKKYKKCCGQ